MDNVFTEEQVQRRDDPVEITFQPGFSPARRDEGERRRLEIKIRMARDATDRAEKAKVERTEIIRSATREAAEIGASARKEAAAIVEAAKAQAAAVADEARRQGLAMAQAAASEEILKRFNVILQTAENAAAAVRASRKEFLTAGAEGMIEIISATLERLLRASIALDRDAVRRAIEHAIENITAADRIVIRVHPDDLGLATELKADIMLRIQGLTQVVFEPDAGVMRGGALLETAFGRVDARLEAQLAELLREITVAVREFPIEGEKA